MKISALIPIGMVFIMIIAALTISASAGCSTCSKEGDWTLSATSFLEGIPINETQQDYGPKATRMTTSQFEKESGQRRRTQKAQQLPLPLRLNPLLTRVPGQLYSW